GVSRATSPKQSVYDPTCGSGSLLLKAAETAAVPISIFGQEMDIATRGLARMNMIMHNRATAEIAQGDVIAEPHFLANATTLQTFDFVVANPPFSAKAWAAGLTEDTKFGRFTDGEPPAKNGDFAFLLHILASMKATGSGAVILPHGVLFRGNAESRLREKILKRGYIKGIIGLPANLFYGTGIPASIIVLDKSQAQENRPVFMIDASKGFIKDGNKNRLRERDIHKVTDAFTKAQEIPGYSRLVPFAEITRNDFNLNIPRYIDGSDPEDLQDISAHLHGGVPERDIDALHEFWDVMPTLRATIFGPNPRAGYADPLVAPDQVRSTIRNHPDFAAFRSQITDILNGWIAQNTPHLNGINQGDHPKALIDTIAEDMLTRFATAPLVDKYEAYQRLMSYWSTTMQDDVFIIAGGGWLAARDLREARKEVAEGKTKWLEEGDLTVGKIRLMADVIPPALITARFFPELKDALDTSTARAEELGREIDELAEEHGAEGGLLADALTDTGKLTAASVKTRDKSGEADAEERPLLKQAAKLIAEEAAAKKAAKEAEAALTAAVFKAYPELTEDDIRTLVVQDKWITDITAAIGAEVEARTESLTARVRVLTERYGQTLPQIMDDLAGLEARVAAHLAAMGVAG
ncbi:MAG: N-6 DNA methylase, partial [Roseovarius sp.]|nr:N-6 DNA methylase [Roseovarius sp.]